MCSASASGELNVRSENQGGLYVSQAAKSYLRFPTAASACDDWFSLQVMHESMLRLNLCMPKLCAEEMCSTHVFIIMLHQHELKTHDMKGEIASEKEKQERNPYETLLVQNLE